MALESGREKAVGSASAIDSNADDFTDVDTNSTIHDGGVDDDDVCGRGRRTTFRSREFLCVEDVNILYSLYKTICISRQQTTGYRCA